MAKCEQYSSVSNFNLNSVFGHELTHNVTGKDTELLANFGEARASGFIEKAIDKGHLAKIGGSIDWNSETLTKEQKDRLASYKDIEEKLKIRKYVDGNVSMNVTNKLKNTFGLENFVFPSNISNLDLEAKKKLGKEVDKALREELRKNLEKYEKVLNDTKGSNEEKLKSEQELYQKYGLDKQNLQKAVSDIYSFILSKDADKAIKNEIAKQIDSQGVISNILNSNMNNKQKIDVLKIKYNVEILENDLKDNNSLISKIAKDTTLDNIIVQNTNKIANDSRWDSEYFKDFIANNQKLTNMQLVIDENDFVHYIQSNGRVSTTGSKGELSFITDKYMYAGEDKAEILSNAVVNTRYNIGEVITNDTIVWGNDKNKYSVGNTDMEKLIRHDKIVYVEPIINNAYVYPENNNSEAYLRYDQNGNIIKGKGANSIVKMDFDFSTQYNALKEIDKYGLKVVEPENTSSYEIYAHEVFAHARHNQEGENDKKRIYYQVYRDNDGIHFAGEAQVNYILPQNTDIKNLKAEEIYNDLLDKLKNSKIIIPVYKNGQIRPQPADKEIIDELENKNSDYYKYFHLEIEEKLKKAKINGSSNFNLNIPFYKNTQINMEEKAAIEKESEIIKQHGMKERGAY